MCVSTMACLPRHVDVPWHVDVAAGRMAWIATLLCLPPHIGVGRHVAVPAPRVIVGRHNAVRPVHVGVDKHIGAAGVHVIVDKHVILPLAPGQRGSARWRGRCSLTCVGTLLCLSPQVSVARHVAVADAR